MTVADQVAAQVTVQLNGVAQVLSAPATVADAATLVAGEAAVASGAGLAVALDGEVVPHAQWAATPVVDGSVVDVLTAFVGG